MVTVSSVWVWLLGLYILTAVYGILEMSRREGSFTLLCKVLTSPAKVAKDQWHEAQF